VKWGIDEEMRNSRLSLPSKKIIESIDPFSEDKPLVLVPAVNPDVTILHVHKASEDGVARIEGLSFADIEQARASKHVIISCEELVSSDTLRIEPWLNCFPHTIVDAVVHQPYGSHPTACYGQYDYDSIHLDEYKQKAIHDGTFKEYLETHIFGVQDFNEYLNVIGRDRLDSIAASPNFGYRKREGSI
jgi:glutaconate CoA-transferase subunit A